MKENLEHNLHQIYLAEGDALCEFDGSGFPLAIPRSEISPHLPGELLPGAEDIRVVCLRTPECPCDNCTDARS